ncbi:MAG: hydroxymethylbilane synthase [Bacteroidota bacterium]
MDSAQSTVPFKRKYQFMTLTRTIRIATRSSPLAVWQAETVKQRLEHAGHHCELVLIESSGDIELTQPLYAMGISGVFTKQLDIALLNNQADIAVHSLKDVPTVMADGLCIAAVIERGAHEDVVIVKNKALLDDVNATATIATSSLRRRAQWLAKYPNHTVVPIRGNVQTRLRKFAEDENMAAVIFAKAGLERLNLLTDNTVTLDWMLPAPSQGIVGIACLENNLEIKNILSQINNETAYKAGFIERQFLNTLMGGCSVPVSALAIIEENEKFRFRGAIHGFDGKNKFEVDELIPLDAWETAGKEQANKLLAQQGATVLMDTIRNTKWNNEGTVN